MVEFTQNSQQFIRYRDIVLPKVKEYREKIRKNKKKKKNQIQKLRSRRKKQTCLKM